MGKSFLSENDVDSSRKVYNAAVWYYNHLAGLRPVVMITEDTDTILEYSALNSGVYVISTQVCSFISCQICSVLSALNETNILVH